MLGHTVLDTWPPLTRIDYVGYIYIYIYLFIYLCMQYIYIYRQIYVYMATHSIQNVYII